jgi:2,4-dienoyl-CoA reductase-like NADH-dependent reductase (Old Yellow Enzyme family)
MWTPAQRIKYRPDPGPVPSAEQAAASRLFSPIRVGPLTLNERTWVPAMVPWRASEDGFVTEEILDWYERFGRGRPGAIVVEATGIRDIPSGPLLRIGHDRFIPGLSQLVDTVHRASDGHTRLFIQIIDFLSIRRRPDPAKFFQRYLQITDRHRERLNAWDWRDESIREHLAALSEQQQTEILDPDEIEALRFGYRERVTDLHMAHIRDLPQVLPNLFADAARRARQAGFDGVELHYAHAYTMASFLSATNTRTDGYGGPLKNRLRLPIEVYQRVRESAGADFVVGCRYLSDECIAGGNTVDDAECIGVALARTGMDFLSLSRGGKFDDAKQPSVGWAAYPYTGRSGYECMPGYISDQQGPFGRNVAPAARIRAAVHRSGLNTPIVVCGGIHGFAQAEAILERGDADIIAAARQSLADPDWFEKIRMGHGDQVRVCEYTNYCEGLDQKHKQVTCQLWDRLQLGEPGVKLTRDRKRRLTAPPWAP